LRIALRVQAVRGDAEVVRRRALQIAVGHVLPNEQAETIAVMIPAGGLDLDLFARHVETEFLHGFDVGAEGFVGRCGVEAVGPPALVERTELEVRTIVQQDAGAAVFVLAERDLAHGEVAIDLVDRRARAREGNAQPVERGRFWRPEARTRNREGERAAGVPRGARHLAPAIERDGLHTEPFGGTTGHDG
jgi:hypothetical protein